MGGYRDYQKYQAALRAGKKDLFDISSGKELLIALLLVGGYLTVLHFAPYLLAAAIPLSRSWDNSPKNRRRFNNSFAYLKRRGYVRVRALRDKNHIELTELGKQVARRGYTRVLALQQPPTKKWDGKWRLILFDVPTDERTKRNAFRSLISRLGAIMLQKSVWIYPHDCSEQIEILKDFFDLNDSIVRLVIADSIGNDEVFRKRFKLQ